MKNIKIWKKKINIFVVHFIITLRIIIKPKFIDKTETYAQFKRNNNFDIYQIGVLIIELKGIINILMIKFVYKNER